MQWVVQRMQRSIVPRMTDVACVRTVVRSLNPLAFMYRVDLMHSA